MRAKIFFPPFDVFVIQYDITEDSVLNVASVFVCEHDIEHDIKDNILHSIFIIDCCMSYCYFGRKGVH